MMMAFVLINSKPGAEDEVTEALRVISEVKEIYKVYGVYGLIIRIEGETLQELKEITGYKIRRLDNVRSTIILVCV